MSIGARSATDILKEIGAMESPSGSSSPTLSGLAKSVLPTGGMYLGDSFPKRTRRGTYGRKVAGWTGALQNSGGTVSFVTDLPPLVDSATRSVRLGQNASLSFAQYSCDGGQAYMPTGRGTGPSATPTTGGFSAGVWVKNPGTRTLNFLLQLYNVAANRSVQFYGAIEPGGWKFITFSPTQDAGGSWQRGVDAVSLVRVQQRDAGAEGAWDEREYLLFGNVYVDVAARPRFLLTFDDGVITQRYPHNSPFVSGTANVTSTLADVLTTGAAHGLIIGAPIQFSETAPTSLAAGTTYWVKTVPSTTTMTLATDATLATTATTTGFAGTAKWAYAGTQDRSIQQVVESYGFRGSLFPAGQWIGTTGKHGYGGGSNQFMTADDLMAMWEDGWAIGSHSFTHPSNGDNAGLRLLGPYGYYLSNAYDNLPLQYRTNFGITIAYRKRVTSSTQASPSVFTTENAHQLLVNQPIVFTDVAPTGCTLGVTYYVRSAPSTTTFTLATDQGVLSLAVNNTSGAWAGTANYKHPGSALDDSAIYEDVIAGAKALRALGIHTAYQFFALPQGSADEYVRSACIRAGFSWVRGAATATAAHSIPIGAPSGGGLPLQHGGWMLQPDAVQTDGVVPLSTLTGYVDETVTQGACGCSYHHGLSNTNVISLDRLCAYLRVKSDAGVIDVVTCDELAKELGI